jgi:predicted metalloprotease with PDZ domain
VKTYGFDDVVAALNAVAPNDWAAFFRKRVYDIAPRAPLAGIENGGWKLAYTDARPELTRAAEEQSKLYDFWYSLGMVVQGDGDSPEDGTIKDVVPGASAARAGVAPGMRLIAVNGRRYKEQGLRDALRSAKDQKAPLALLVENLDTFQTLDVEEHGGERYPRLERDSAKPDLVSAIGAARTKQESPPGP